MVLKSNKNVALKVAHVAPQSHHFLMVHGGGIRFALVCGKDGLDANMALLPR
jgi:hypothetical protein